MVLADNQVQKERFAAFIQAMPPALKGKDSPMRYRWALSLVLLCGSGVTRVAAEDEPLPPLIYPPAVAKEIWAACKEGRMYGRIEGMAWFIKDAHTPPLITFGSASDAIPGALGQPGTSIAFGGDLDTKTHTGGQFTLGYWFNTDHSMGMEANYWFLNQRGVEYSAGSSGNVGALVISRPFFDPNSNIENADPVALTGVQAGSTSARFTDRLQGAEFNFLGDFVGEHWAHFNLIVGVRVFTMVEGLNMNTNTAALPLSTGIVDTFAESFRTRNQFVGGQIGADSDMRFGDFEVDLRGTFALGGNYETALIDGLARHNDPAGAIAAPGGLFTQVTNIGHHERGSFTYFTEVGGSLAYWWTEYFSLRAGYRFFYINSVIRPGDQMDRTVSIQPVPPPSIPVGVGRPIFSFKESDFWAHGVNFGCELRF